MTWLTWRLQRTELILLGVIVLVLGALLLQTHADVVAQSRRYTAETCPVPLSGTELGCSIPVSRLYRLVSEWLPWFTFLPLLAALLLALPTVLELEQGTYRLAWTQGVTRGHWARTKLGILSLCGLAFAALFTLTFSWWSSPNGPLNGSLGQDDYDLRGTLPIGNTLFAIGLMLAVGTVLRRPTPAIVLASVVYVAVRMPFAVWIRPHLIAPSTRVDGSSYSNGDWQISAYWLNGAGDRLSQQDYMDLCYSTPNVSRNDAWNCVTQNGLVNMVTYHPVSHYWPLQLVETGIFLAAGVALIGFAARYVLRRIE